MKLGTVIYWRNFPYQRHGLSKPRFFVYLGRTQYGDTKDDVYLFTTTSHTEYFDAGRKRADHLIVPFKQGEYGFSEDCVLDLDEKPHALTPPDIERCKKDIQYLDTLPTQKLREIYEKINRSNNQAGYVRSDIHNSFMVNGIEDISKPRKRRKSG